MKKALISTLAVMLATAAITQDTARYKSALVPGTQWYEMNLFQTQNLRIIAASARLIIDSTTIIVDSTMYHVVDYRPYSGSCIFFPVACLRESEDQSKVYGRYYYSYNDVGMDDYSRLSDETLLMNLDLDVGDTFDLIDQEYLRVRPYHPPIKAVVDSVYFQDGLKHIRFASFHSRDQELWESSFELDGSEDILNKFTKHVAFEFIESIGCTWGYSYYAEESSTPPQRVMSRLLCLYRNGELIYTPYEDDNHPRCLICMGTSAIDTIDMTQPIIASPNPVLDYLTLSQMPYGEKTIIIQDATGREWMKLYNFGQSAQINLSHLPRQIYFLSVLHESGVFTQKIIKQ